MKNTATNNTRSWFATRNKAWEKDSYCNTYTFRPTINRRREMVLPLCNAAWKIYILNLMISKWVVFNEKTLRRELLTLDTYKSSTSHLNPMPKELKMISFGLSWNYQLVHVDVRLSDYGWRHRTDTGQQAREYRTSWWDLNFPNLRITKFKFRATFFHHCRSSSAPYITTLIHDYSMRSNEGLTLKKLASLCGGNLTLYQLDRWQILIFHFAISTTPQFLWN